MSENEIKPVAWCAVDDMRNEWAFAWGGTDEASYQRTEWRAGWNERDREMRR